MGTGIITQLLTNFPYPAEWLRTLGYCFWILNIILFSVFTSWFITRFVWYPSLFRSTLEDFTQSNFLGAIPMGFDTIIIGLITFYHNNHTAVWVAYAFFWVSVAMTVAVSMGAVFIMFVKQPQHKLEEITGV
jgi:tellurite resistance protein TehA-like permease